MLQPSPSRHHDKTSAAPGSTPPVSLPETSKVGRDRLAVPDLPFRSRWSPDALGRASLLGYFLAVTIVRHRSGPYFEPGERAAQGHDK